MKRIVLAFLVSFLLGLAQAQSPYVTVTGVVAGANGLPAANDNISFQPTQNFFVAVSGTQICSYDYLFEINAVALTPCDTVNFNSTTPAAPSGSTNIVFQTSKSGTIDSVSAYIPSQSPQLHCQSGLGDGLNAIPAGTYIQVFCYNDSSVTWTIAGIRCYTDNSGTSQLNSYDNNGNLLTSLLTCSPSFAPGTQTIYKTIAAGGYIQFYFVADGTSKQTTWTVLFTQ